MGKIFSVYAANGSKRYAELDLPASGYAIQDSLDWLRLPPGQPSHLEIRQYHGCGFLRNRIGGQLDICQLNALAKRLSELQDTQGMAVFEGLVEIDRQSGAVPIPLARLMDFAHSVDCCHVAPGVTNDRQLGRFLAENGIVPELGGVTDAASHLVDFERTGREHRQAEGGVFTSFGYVEPHTEPRHINESLDAQALKPPYTVLLDITEYPADKRSFLGLPATDSQIGEALEKLGRTDWGEVPATVDDSPILCWKNASYSGADIPQLNELAGRLRELDERGQLPRYKAILSLNGCEGLPEELPRMLSLAGEVDSYRFEPQISDPEDVARRELGAMLDEQDAKALLPHINLEAYGRALLERDHAKITRYGLVERIDEQQLQGMGQPSPQDMEQPFMGGMALS